MSAAAPVGEYLAALDVAATEPEPGRWRCELDCAGLPLILELTRRGDLLRAEAAVLPPDLIAPAQLLFWNRQAPLVCFACDRDGAVLVCGEIPLGGLDGELLDRFLGLLHASAARARQFVLGDRAS